MRKTTLLMASAAAMALPAVAQAADMPVRRAAPVVQTFSWTGVYIGASGGQLRGGSDDWVSGTPLSCNNAPLTFPTASGRADVASSIINNPNNFGVTIGGGTSGTGVAGCYPTPTGVTTAGAVQTVNGSGGLAPALIASQGSIPTTAINNSLKTSLYGGQVGYNHQFLYRFVGGFEADFHVARGASDLTLNSLTGNQTVPGYENNSIFTNFAASETMRYFGTLRARLGWLPWDPVLLYATGGLAYARITSTTVVTQSILGPCGGTWVPGTLAHANTCGVSPAFGESTNWRAGITYGGGIEVALGARWSIKGEYLYYKFGNWTYDLTPLTATTNGATPFFTTGVAATTRSFNGSRWVVGINYNFGAPASAIER